MSQSNRTRMLVMLLAMSALCVLPVAAQPPTPLPNTDNQIERLIQAFERGVVTTSQNINGGLILLCAGLIAFNIIREWKYRQPVETVNPTLAGVIAKQQEGIEERDELLKRQVVAWESISEGNKAFHQLLREYGQQTKSAEEGINTIAESVGRLLTKGSQPLQDAVTLLDAINQRTQNMSETQLTNLSNVVDALKQQLVGAIKGTEESHKNILAAIEKKRTDSHPVAAVPDTQSE